MITMVVVGGLFLVTCLVLTACQSSLALGRTEESPLSTPTVWPEWLPLPATDIWSVPSRPVTPVPAEGRVHPTPILVSPLPTPTLLSSREVRVTALEELQALSTMEDRLIAPDFDARTIAIIARDRKSIVTADVTTHQVRILDPGELMDFDSRAEIWLSSLHVSGRYVVWVARWRRQGTLFVYDLQTNRLSSIARDASLADADLSDHIVIWRQLEEGRYWHILGYDLERQTYLKIVTGPRGALRPQISGEWVIYEDWTERDGSDVGLYLTCVDDGEEIRLGSVYAPGDQAVPSFYAIDSPWVGWTTGHWSDAPELHLFNLETHQAYTITVEPCGASASRPRRLGNLAISGGTVIFTCGQPMGYDIEREVFFSIPIYAAKPAGEEWGFGGWSIAGDRIVWVLSSEQESRVYTAQIEHRP